MSELVAVGKCIFCNQEFSKSNISRHLAKHLSEKTGTGKPGKSFLIKIDTNPKWGASPYFLHLWVDGNSTMQVIDTFLRKIWLECCGHMSAFRNPKQRGKGGGMWDLFEVQNLLMKGKKKEYEMLMEESNGEISMSRKTKDALQKGLKLVYEYDFGSTTELHLTVTGEYPIHADEKYFLLSRNEPPEMLCEMCGTQPATRICSECMNYDESAFCNKCGKIHGKSCSGFNDYGSMPVVNSPRMGVCGYEGGTIDKKRGGPFVKK